MVELLGCFIENEYRSAITVNDVCYCEMVTAFLWPQLEAKEFSLVVNEMFFQ